MKARLIGLVAPCFWLSGCATIVEGTSQNIIVAANPPNAECEATRKGEALGRTGPQSTALHVSKSRNDIELTCRAPGYQPQMTRIESSLTAGGTASILLIDMGITDYATGALNKYPDTVAVTLVPAPQAAAPAPAAAMKPVTN